MQEFFKPFEIVEDTIKEVEKILDFGIQSSEERDELLRKLDTALAISNDPKVHSLIRDVEERYGKKEAE